MNTPANLPHSASKRKRFLRLSNFIVHEDRANGDFIIQMTRMFYEEKNNMIWGDACLYRVEP